MMAELSCTTWKRFMVPRGNLERAASEMGYISWEGKDQKSFIKNSYKVHKLRLNYNFMKV